jgi:hypothetical protein
MIGITISLSILTAFVTSIGYNHSKERCPKLNAAKKASAKRTGQSSSEVN